MDAYVFPLSLAAAAALGLAGFTRNMLAIRLMIAAAALTGGITAWIAGQNLVVVLCLAAFVINAFRLAEIHNTSRRIRHIRHYGYNIADLRKYMKPMAVKANHMVFEKGDPADLLYLVDSGIIEVENGARVEKNGLLGETGLFTKSGTRSMGARALTDVQLGTLDADEVGRLCLNDPEFAYAIAQIMARRMADNQRRYEEGR
ncbi:MAG: Crp/Fnr family transcriptional regulator [Phyllobacteriaceae bacterium]|nr:Crp/Fnr family transcriptional regulator [Phyllobacteriaceae bacterium]